MRYSVSDGVIISNFVAVNSASLFKMRSFTAEFEGVDVTYVVAKRPAQIKFYLERETFSHFDITFRNSTLNFDQLNSLKEHGYFLDATHRVYFVTDLVRTYIDEASSPLSIPKLLSLLRKLYNDDLIDSFPENLVETLSKSEALTAVKSSLFEKELYPYQKEGIEWLIFCFNHGLGTILADDMGLGKTAQVIALICDALERNPSSRILIVVPNPLLDNWKREFEFFSPSLTPYVHYGKKRRGIASEIEKYSIIITPYTTLSSDISMFEDINFELALFDEASMLKNPFSTRSIAARKVISDVKIAMSGTPVENSLMDAWALADLVFEGYLGSIGDFKSSYIRPDIRETLNINLYKLEQSLSQITLRRMKKDVLGQLPNKQDIHIAVTASDREVLGYESIIQEMRENLDGGRGNILPLINKLQQYTAHPALLDPTIRTDCKTLASYSAKFELMVLQLDKIKGFGEKVLIFVTFQRAIDLIQNAIEEKYGLLPGVIDGRTPNEKRQPLIDQFSSSSGFDVLILHPKTAGMGFNITAATNVIHYCRQWNPALEEQATARAWRNGQKEAVSVFYMYYANTVEEIIDERIRLKQELSDRVVSVTDDKETDKKIMMDYLESLI